MTVDVTESIQSTIHPAFQLLRQHHVEALDIQVSEYKHKVTGAIHYHLATENDENVFLVAFNCLIINLMDSRKDKILTQTEISKEDAVELAKLIFLKYNN